MCHCIGNELLSVYQTFQCTEHPLVLRWSLYWGSTVDTVLKCSCLRGITSIQGVDFAVVAFQGFRLKGAYCNQSLVRRVGMLLLLSLLLLMMMMSYISSAVVSTASLSLRVAMPCWLGWEAVASRVSPGWQPQSATWRYSRSNSEKAMVLGTSRYV